MAKSKTTVVQDFAVCPACGKMVTGRFELELTVEEKIAKQVDAKGTVTGMQVSHDCIPKTTRGPTRTVTPVLRGILPDEIPPIDIPPEDIDEAEDDRYYRTGYPSPGPGALTDL